MNDEVRFKLMSYEMKVAAGIMPGASYIEKFGRNAAVASGVQEPIWDGSGVYSYPTNGRIHEIESTDADDAGAGAGARTVEIQGLDENYLQATETVTLISANPVDTKYLYSRIFRMRVMTAGASETNEGVITATAKTDATVTAQINVGNGQTNMAIYTIPAGKTGYLVHWYCGLLRASGTAALAADLDIFRRGASGAWRSTQPQGIQNTGHNHWHFHYTFPLTLPAQSDIEIRATPTAPADITAGFTILLLDN